MLTGTLRFSIQTEDQRLTNGPFLQFDEQSHDIVDLLRNALQIDSLVHEVINFLYVANWDLLNRTCDQVQNIDVCPRISLCNFDNRYVAKIPSDCRSGELIISTTWNSSEWQSKAIESQSKEEFIAQFMKASVNFQTIPSKIRFENPIHIARMEQRRPDRTYGEILLYNKLIDGLITEQRKLEEADFNGHMSEILGGDDEVKVEDRTEIWCFRTLVYTVPPVSRLLAYFTRAHGPLRGIIREDALLQLFLEHAKPVAGHGKCVRNLRYNDPSSLPICQICPFEVFARRYVYGISEYDYDQFK